MKKAMLFIVAVMLGGSLTVPALAAQARYAVHDCPQCGGNARSYTTRTYAHDEVFSCAHGKNGNDYYAVYEVKDITYCENCPYHNEVERKEHVFKSCGGR
mgnify:CR=1 FL=1